MESKMNLRLKVSFCCYILILLQAITFSVIYLLRSEFMPFHASIVEMADNVYLTDYLREVYQRTFLRHRIEGLKGGRSHEVVKEHDRIYRAIEVRDVSWAQELIKSHIKAGMNYIFPVIFGEEE